MNNLLITRLPTLVNIEGMGIKELREQYKRLEGEAIDQSQQLSQVCNKLHQMNKFADYVSSELAVLIDSYDAGDQAAILLQLKKHSEKRKDWRADQKAKVH
ncbi:MAG: hypothetical protein C0406_04480 [Sideroxydans sp.]|nr:hypothetical protein [Sideroxydans sp.]